LSMPMRAAMSAAFIGFSSSIICPITTIAISTPRPARSTSAACASSPTPNSIPTMPG
jgi:hypothetical protein